MKFSRILILLSIVCLLYSCVKKNTGLSGYIKDLDFAYTDSLSVGKNIKFYSTAPANSKFLWSFGTGETSTADSPMYKFYVPRAYTVSVQVNDTGKPVAKTIYISIGLDILGKMTKGRSWNLHYTAHDPSHVPADTDTVYAVGGSMFNINNDTSLTTNSGVLSYMAPSNLLPASKVLEFGLGNVNNTSSAWTVAYYDYNADSLDYVIYSPITGGYIRSEYTSTH